MHEYQIDVETNATWIVAAENEEEARAIYRETGELCLEDCYVEVERMQAVTA